MSLFLRPAPAAHFIRCDSRAEAQSSRRGRN